MNRSPKYFWQSSKCMPCIPTPPKVSRFSGPRQGPRRLGREAGIGIALFQAPMNGSLTTTNLAQWPGGYICESHTHQTVPL